MNQGEAVSIRRPFARSAEAGAVAGARSRVGTALAATAIVAGALGLRIAFGPAIDGLDDAGYLDAAQRVSDGRSLENMYALFQTRVGMAYPLGWLLAIDALEPAHFWILTLLAETITVVSLFAAGWLFSGAAAAGLAAAALYAIYPLAVQQAVMYYPTAFQVASIASALALVSLAERQPGSLRWGLGFAAGISLGLGYLFKEDVAIVVPAFALAALITRVPRVTTALALCGGAALIFAVECVAYWQLTGNPLFRLVSASGLGAPLSDQLQIAAIWKWDAFLRTLWLIPTQVGLMWWIALPAAWFGLRQRGSRRGIAFVTASFVIVMAYLQFGSGSLTSYSPLPKTPRYTALATPGLMLITGAWLGWLFATHRRVALATSGAIAIAALPCIAYLNVSSTERTRNTLAAWPVMETLGPGTLYTDYFSARVMRLLDPERDIRVWYHADFQTNTMSVWNSPEPGSYVLLDLQSAKLYTSSYDYRLPAEVSGRSKDWTPVWTHRAYPEGSWARSVLESIRSAARWLPSGNPLSSRVERSVADIIDGDNATLYRVPGSSPLSD